MHTECKPAAHLRRGNVGHDSAGFPLTPPPTSIQYAFLISFEMKHIWVVQLLTIDAIEDLPSASWITNQGKKVFQSASLSNRSQLSLFYKINLNGEKELNPFIQNPPPVFCLSKPICSLGGKINEKLVVLNWSDGRSGEGGMERV